MGCIGCNSKKKTRSCKNSGSCSRCSNLSVFDWLSNLTPPSNEKNDSLIELSFKNGRKNYYSNNGKININLKDPVAVRSDVGFDIGLVSLKGELVRLQLRRKKISTKEIAPILRQPSSREIAAWHDTIKLEKPTMLKARKIVKTLDLKMKITDVEYQADRKKAIFYYVADERVDFRELLKILTKEFNVKILLKQVGARQESSIIGGLGSCGRELCCSSWITERHSVSLSAARYQKLSLNPQKLTGQCGKLKCCLNYELENYMTALKNFPNTKTLINTKRGKAEVQKIDIFKKIIWYSYLQKNQDWIQVSVDSVHKMLSLNRRGNENFLIEDFVEKQLPFVK